MNVNIKARNLEVSPALREYLEKRLAKFEKLIGVSEAQATLSLIKGTRRVEVTIALNGVILRGEEEDYDMYAAIDKVVEKLERQVHRYKTRLSKKIRGIPKNVNLANYENKVDEIAESDEIPVRVKHFGIKPMPVDEAIMQMNLLGHAFFVFLNAEDNQVNVVYRRKDGAYGLLIPEA
ncbi:MAG: ribosome-associated translation inhibitor RaiA [Clostridiales bacterium]